MYIDVDGKRYWGREEQMATYLGIKNDATSYSYLGSVIFVGTQSPYGGTNDTRGMLSVSNVEGYRIESFFKN